MVRRRWEPAVPARAACCRLIRTAWWRAVVTPLGAGTIGLQAADGSVVVNATFTAVNKPDVLAVVSLPANGSWVGEAAASAFAVRVFAGDGVTPVAGRSVVLSVVNGLATLGACGAASCAVSTDATGLALSAVTPGATGTITLMAADGTVTQSASFTSAVRPDAVTLVSVPGDGALVGDVAAANFAVKVAAGGAASSGQGVSGRSVTLSLTSGSATLDGVRRDDLHPGHGCERHGANGSLAESCGGDWVAGGGWFRDAGRIVYGGEQGRMR